MAIFRQLTIDFAKLSVVSGDCACKSVVISRPLDRVLLGEQFDELLLYMGRGLALIVEIGAVDAIPASF